MKIPIFPNNSFRQGKNFSWERTDPNCFHIKVDFLFLGADFLGFFCVFSKSVLCAGALQVDFNFSHFYKHGWMDGKCFYVFSTQRRTCNPIKEKLKMSEVHLIAAKKKKINYH